ncbi:MAG TPA: fimbria/pilus periplasmic chaperone [Candidatus Acidoferrum sp.]|nr:fimbria/pilus periplasmic chaperone [Candidatus Acidoferrum sp.]
MKRSGAISLAAVVALLVLSAGAFAADYSISPIPVTVPIGTKTASMTVRNRGSEPLHLAVRVFDWKQSADSAMILTPNTALVVYPRSLTVAPSTQQTVRIGLPATSGNEEVAYRVLFEELPNPNALTGVKGSGVVVRTNIGVPLFIEPEKATAAQKISGAVIRRTSLNLDLENDGDVHIEPTVVTAVGTDSSGKQTFSVTTAGWYILRGATRGFAFTIPPNACASTTSIAATAGTGHNVFKGSTTQITRSCS